MDESLIKERLSQENEEFKAALEKHQEYEKQLAVLSRKSYLTDDEKMLEKELKKKKLALKDRMYVMMAKYRKSLQ